MKIASNKRESENFWVVYADLMAGLLFVFIVLVGGIIVKYVFTQASLKQTEQEYALTSALLADETRQKNELDALNKMFEKKLGEIELRASDLKKANSLYIIQLEELQKVADKLRDENLNLGEYLRDLEAQNAAKDANISDSEAKIAYLLETITDKDRDIARVMADLNITKNMVDNLSGVQVRIVSAIKDALGSDVRVDPKSGALSLSSSVLFEKGSAELLESGKPALQSALEKYFAVLMRPEIRESLDMILIEGHTDSDGGYLYNLKLSQERAYAVMEFINSFSDDAGLKALLNASGRSYTDPVMRGGAEDKDASRRIEIKFMISNKKAIDEISRFLEHGQ